MGNSKRPNKGHHVSTEEYLVKLNILSNGDVATVRKLYTTILFVSPNDTPDIDKAYNSLSLGLFTFKLRKLDKDLIDYRLEDIQSMITVQDHQDLYDDVKRIWGEVCRFSFLENGRLINPVQKGVW